VRRLCERDKPAQLDQGLWAIFGQVRCLRFIFDSKVAVQARIACIESMYAAFRDVVSHYEGDIEATFYWMWWNMIMHEFHPVPKEYKLGYVKLTDDEQSMIDVIFRTLAKILALPHRGCQVAALHGLGHLYHPEAARLIEAYIDGHRTELSEEQIQYAEYCRDNKVQ
jgi:hypothetical protein